MPRNDDLTDAYDRRHILPRRSDDSGMRVNWQFVISVLGLVIIIIGGLISISSRVTALENQSRNDAARMHRIEDKLDRLLERVK